MAGGSLFAKHRTLIERNLLNLHIKTLCKFNNLRFLDTIKTKQIKNLLSLKMIYIFQYYENTS